MWIIAAALFFAVAGSSFANAQSASDGWKQADEISVQYPANVFSVRLGDTERYHGSRYGTADGEARLAMYSFANAQNETPARFLRRTLVVDPGRIVYKRVTSKFFVLSDIRQDQIYYSRCNFSSTVRCVFLEYPASQKSRWDRTVTRISHSLR